MKYIQTGAIFSECRTWRYSLWRKWDMLNERRMIFIGLNPSTADENEDDPTIRRCIGFAKKHSCGGIVMLNLFAFRATDPKEMMAAPDPIGPHNDVIIKNHADRPDQIFIAAWGTMGTFKDRDLEVSRMVYGLRCFGFTKYGMPRHPLYLKADSPIILYKPRVK